MYGKKDRSEKYIMVAEIFSFRLGPPPLPKTKFPIQNYAIFSIMCINIGEVQNTLDM